MELHGLDTAMTSKSKTEKTRGKHRGWHKAPAPPPKKKEK